VESRYSASVEADSSGSSSDTKRPLALITGVGRREGIGAGIARELARQGWDLAVSYWMQYDVRVHGVDAHDAGAAVEELRRIGAEVRVIEADLRDAGAPARLLAEAGEEAPVRALVLSHAESVDSSILDTSVESFDRHIHVNARATWLLVKAFAEQFPPSLQGLGRIVAITSDHTVHNLPYGASKGALDRIVLAAARELAPLGITANVINPGPTETGWMTDDQRHQAAAQTPLGRVSTPEDCARLVTWLCSPEGGWINAQLLHSNGGFQ
jgi:3-oxoacyl-[acyl-carrier protein] reductase